MTDIAKKLRSPIDEKEDYFISQWPGEEPKTHDAVRFQAADEIERLRADNQKAALEYLGQIGQLSDELERTKREAERAQDAYGVRFLNYLEETARLTDDIECLKAELRTASDMNAVYEGRLQEKEADNESLRLALEVAANDLEDWGAYTKAKNARAALEGK